MGRSVIQAIIDSPQIQQNILSLLGLIALIISVAFAIRRKRF